MRSAHDSAVYALRNRIPFVGPRLTEFMRAMASNGTATLTCDYRHQVSTRHWWHLSWTDNDGKEYGVSSQELDLCLWRAIQRYRVTNAGLTAMDDDRRTPQFEGGAGI